MKLEITVPEVKELINNIQSRGKFFDMLRIDVQEGIGTLLSEIMEKELTSFLGREKYERVEIDINYRNGGYDRQFTMKGIGKVKVHVPRDRKGDFETQVIPRSQQYEDLIKEDLSVMFLTGVSTRSLSLISRKLIGRNLSHSEVSKANLELTEAVEKWRCRPLNLEKYKYLFIDGTNFKMRIDGTVETITVLVVIGVTESGHKTVLVLQAGDKESSSNWRQLFKDLKQRGLDSSSVQLGIMDGLPGLEKVFSEEFPKAKTQRCQVHVARNVLSKVPKKLKKQIGDEIRSIFYASSKKKALEFFSAFEEKWEKEIPSAVKCLTNSLDSCLTYLDFPDEDWISLRTTNVIERLNKEFKRRTRPMEIVAGENACYRLLAFICIKMEMHWRSAPIGKVQKNLPFFNQFS